jgi:hypothetical protein
MDGDGRKEGKDGKRDCVHLNSVVHGAMGCGQKKLSVSVTVSPAPVRVSSQRSLALIVTSVANDKGENKIILGAVNRSPGICLTVEEKLGKSQLGDLR